MQHIGWICILLFLPFSFGVHLKIVLSDKTGTRDKEAQLICEPTETNPPKVISQNIVWKGKQFGSKEKENLLQNTDGRVFVPNIKVNSSENYKCYLVTSKNGKKLLKKRREVQLNYSIPKEGEASIAAVNGNCPPGYRIDRYRCFQCFPGSYTSGQDTQCFLCPKDFYMTKAASDSCWPCPEGKKTIAPGADSEEACVYLDKDGRPVYSPMETQWLVIAICLGIVLLSVWIIIIVIILKYFQRKKSKPGLDKLEKGEKVPLMSRIRKGFENIFDGDNVEDHIYESIDEDDQGYEVPIEKPEHIYEEIEDYDQVPAEYDEVPAEYDEVPVEKVESGGYEVPIKPGNQQKTSGSANNSQNNRRVSGEHIYDDVPNASTENKHIYDSPDDGFIQMHANHEYDNSNYVNASQASSKNESLGFEMGMNQNQNSKYHDSFENKEHQNGSKLVGKNRVRKSSSEHLKVDQNSYDKTSHKAKRSRSSTEMKRSSNILRAENETTQYFQDALNNTPPMDFHLSSRISKTSRGSSNNNAQKKATEEANIIPYSKTLSKIPGRDHRKSKEFILGDLSGKRDISDQSDRPRISVSDDDARYTDYNLQQDMPQGLDKTEKPTILKKFVSDDDVIHKYKDSNTQFESNVYHPRTSSNFEKKEFILKKSSKNDYLTDGNRDAQFKSPQSEDSINELPSKLEGMKILHKKSERVINSQTQSNTQSEKPEVSEKEQNNFQNSDQDTNSTWSNDEQGKEETLNLAMVDDDAQLRNEIADAINRYPTLGLRLLNTATFPLNSETRKSDEKRYHLQ